MATLFSSSTRYSGASFAAALDENDVYCFIRSEEGDRRTYQIRELPASGDAYTDLETIRDHWEANGGLLDSDGNLITTSASDFGPNISTIEDVEEHGLAPNIFRRGGYEAWRDQQKVEGAFIREGSYSEDATTGRPIITTPFDDIPGKRNPGTANYNFPLSPIIASQVGNDIYLRLPFDDDAEVTSSNINDQFLVEAFLAWIEGLRDSGSAVGTDITAAATLSSRNFELAQGGSAATLDLVAASSSPLTGFWASGNYSHVTVILTRASGETDAISISDIRDTLASATGSIAAADDQETSTRGALDTPHYASEYHLPNGAVIKPNRRGGVSIARKSRGELPVDNAHVDVIRYADLDNRSGGGKLMPLNASVIHFDEGESADGSLYLRTISDHVEAEAQDWEPRIHNGNTSRNCTIYTNDATELIRLKPTEDCGLQVGLTPGGGGAEVLVLDNPERVVELIRGNALSHFGTVPGYVWNTGDGGDGNTYYPLPWHSATIDILDSDAFEAGSQTPITTTTNINNVGASNWDIGGSFKLKRPGFVSLDLLLRLQLVEVSGQTLSGEMGSGCGISLWTLSADESTLARDRFLGLPAAGGLGVLPDYILERGRFFPADTRLIFLFRVTQGTDLSNLNHLDVAALNGSLKYTPHIREAITL